MLVNGRPADLISIHDRGLLYGDGVFRTLCVKRGELKHWPRHHRKLQHDCAALGLQCPEADVLYAELQQLIHREADAVAKIIITRGTGERGYFPPPDAAPTRVVSVAPIPPFPGHYATEGIALRICRLRLGHQPALAGVKHLNRLENVLAAAEFRGGEFPEGLLLDGEENVIEGIRSNLFMLKDGILMTPDLSFCGVAGVQRERVMEWASIHGVPLHIRRCGLGELLASEEIFLVNSVIGLWPVRELAGRTWSHHPVALRIQKWLNDAQD